MNEEWLVHQLKEILQKIEYLSEDTEIVLLANEGLDEIDNYTGRSKFLTTYAKRT